MHLQNSRTTEHLSLKPVRDGRVGNGLHYPGHGGLFQTSGNGVLSGYSQGDLGPHPKGMALVSSFLHPGPEDEARKASAGTHALQPLRAKQGELGLQGPWDTSTLSHMETGAVTARGAVGPGAATPSRSRRGAHPAGVCRVQRLLPASLHSDSRRFHSPLMPQIILLLSVSLLPALF